MTDQVHCPKCGSTQVQAFKRGYSIWTGVIGSNQVFITCLACGNKFKPGQPQTIHDYSYKKPIETNPEGSSNKYLPVLFLIGVGVIILICFLSISTPTPISPSNQNDTMQLFRAKDLTLQLQSSKDSLTRKLVSKKHYRTQKLLLTPTLNNLTDSLSEDDRQKLKEFSILHQ